MIPLPSPILVPIFTARLEDTKENKQMTSEELNPLLQAGYKEQIITRVMMLMGWNEAKAEAWYNHSNPHLGGLSPAGLVFLDRGHKVIAYIKGREEE